MRAARHQLVLLGLLGAASGFLPASHVGTAALRRRAAASPQQRPRLDSSALFAKKKKKKTVPKKKQAAAAAPAAAAPAPPAAAAVPPPMPMAPPVAAPPPAAAAPMPMAPPMAATPPASAPKKKRVRKAAAPVPAPVTATGAAPLPDVAAAANKPSLLPDLGAAAAPAAVNPAVALPDLNTLKARSANRQAVTESTEAGQREGELSVKQVLGGGKRIPKGDFDLVTRALELDPATDTTDPTQFAPAKESEDLVSSFLGEGAKPFLSIPQSFLQLGHLILAASAILCANAYDPASPLTNLPPEYRAFLSTGLVVVFTINAVLAVLGGLKASERGMFAPFWAIKCFLLGGLAYDELLNTDPSANQGS